MSILRSGCVLVLLCLIACTPLGGDRGAAKKIVLIGGANSEGPGRHEYAQGVRRLQALLQSSPAGMAGELAVEAFPDGWPENPQALQDASTLVWYFDGLNQHPLRNRAHRAQFEALMRRGVGLVVLHQASTVPAINDLGLPQWLGAARLGTFDRTTESAALVPASPAHPVSRGIGRFEYRDEFYPTLAFTTQGAAPVAILQSALHPQFRAGASVLADSPELRTVAWAFERADGGRAFGYSGAHFPASLHEPMLAKLLLNAMYWTAGLPVPVGGVGPGPGDAAQARPSIRAADRQDAPPRPEVATFHHDRGRSGWVRNETVLRPANVSPGSFGLAWESLPLDAVDGQPARLYASPLYVERVTMSAGEHRGARFDVVFAASNNGYVYAVNARKAGDIVPGRILWRKRLGAPCRLQPAPLDGVPTGILSTPIADIARGRIYVTHCDPKQRWQAYALDITSGALLPGWPVRLDEATFNRLNTNAGPSRVPPRRRFDFRVQRGALNLSPDGSLLYVVFGESETGWLVAVDTVAAKVGSAFAAVAMPHRGSGGIWGAGGPAVDAQGNVFVVTGSGFDGYKDQPNDWTQSVLMLSQPGPAGFVLRGTYTPFNHCQTATMDIDLGSGGATLLPEPVRPGASATPRLLAVGGKQGNAYLLDRDRWPGRLDRRPSCSDDASSDASLLAPQAQPQFGLRGPLNVFGPYSEEDAALDFARARSVPAYFRDAGDRLYLFLTGNSKRAEGSAVSIAPSIARLEVVTPAGTAPYLKIDQLETTLVLGNPGSPVVTSNGGRDAIAWVLDENAPRSASLAGPAAPQPVLYALDAMSLKPLWRSAPGELSTSGKYNAPAFGGGQVFVGSDRIQAFALGGDARRAVQAGQPAASKKRVAANAPVAAGPAVPTMAGDSAAIYAQRCAMCHDHPQGNIPPRRLIAGRSRAHIIEVLTHGVMRDHARGLSAAQIEELARYLK